MFPLRMHGSDDPAGIRPFAVELPLLQPSHNDQGRQRRFQSSDSELDAEGDQDYHSLAAEAFQCAMVGIDRGGYGHGRRAVPGKKREDKEAGMMMSEAEYCRRRAANLSRIRFG